MMFSLFDKIFRRRNRKRLRILMRGYSYLKKTNRLGLVRRIKNDLVDCQFIDIPGKTSKAIFGASLVQAEALTRQFLLQRNAGVALNKAILYSLGKPSASVIHPLPKAWQDLLCKHGFHVNRLASTLAWVGYVFLYWGYGGLIFLQLSAYSLWAALRRRTSTLNRFAYFEGLSAGNLPQPGLDGCSHDIFTWYSRWGGRAENLNALYHGVIGTKPTAVGKLRVEYIGRPFQPLKGFTSLMRFMGWGIKAMAFSALDAMRGRWWHALLLAEAVKAKVVQLSEPGSLAADYLFHYSGTIYRPMWTYEAEIRGSRIICYFYSASEQVKLPTGYESQRYEWGAASWPTYLVWDVFQADLIRRDIDERAVIEVVGPIWFTTSSIEPPEVPEKSIAVFDIQPFRKSAHFGFSTLADYIAKYPDVQIQFLEDIHAVFRECGVTMVFKRKREIGNRGVKKYQCLVKSLLQSEHVIIADPNISAIKVIERCKGIISMPFTSTALYLRDQGVPSAYYDPTGWIQKDDRGAHGIPILSGINELRGWIREIFKTPLGEDSQTSAEAITRSQYIS